MRENDHLIIFDTTLRDGEQSPGASMDIEEKIQIANALNDLNVDVIEAGFPIASNGDFNAVKRNSLILFKILVSVHLLAHLIKIF